MEHQTNALQPPLTQEQIDEQNAIQAWLDACNRKGELVWLMPTRAVTREQMSDIFGSPMSN